MTASTSQVPRDPHSFLRDLTLPPVSEIRCPSRPEAYAPSSHRRCGMHNAVLARNPRRVVRLASFLSDTLINTT